MFPRREFLRSGLVTAGAVVCCKNTQLASQAPAADSHIEILPDEPLGTTTLTASDIHAHNTFAEPTALEPQTKPLSLTGSAPTHVFPPASVTRLTITLD